MSPIIYTPHDCEKPGYDLPAGTLYQCPDCDLVWELEADTVRDGKRLKWWAIEGPRRDIALGAARARAVQPATPTPPTVTPDMVELVLNEYKEHANIGRLDNAWWCARCPDPIPRGLTPAGHARSMAAAALQDALDKAGDTRG